MPTMSLPSATTNVQCPLCDGVVRCTAKFRVRGQATSDGATGLVLLVEAELEPDVVEQFKPHLREAHPREYAQLEARHAS